MIQLLTFALLAQSNFAPLNHKVLPTSSPNFTFIALGDNRPAGPGMPPTANFKEILREVAIIGPTFVISSGDLLYGNEETVEQYKHEASQIQPLLEALPCPFFNAPGNHEMANRPEFLSAYSEVFGAPYGGFDFGNFRFLAVCTDLPGPKTGVYGEELNWLKSALSESKPTVVYQHHPIYPRESQAEKGGVAENGPDLHQLYLKGGVKMVLEGHDHVYNAQTHDGIAYTIAGGAGAPLDADTNDGGYFHYLLVHVKGNEITQTALPLGAIEIVPTGDGSAIVGNYSHANLPISNLQIASQKEPKGATAVTLYHGKSQTIEVTLLGVEKTPTGYLSRIGLTAPVHKPVTVQLSY